jgi:hypothetical protein
MGVPDQQNGADRWFLDHLCVDQGCVPILVETKTSGNPQLRREVVGQLLEYAANGVAFWPIESIRDRFHQQWQGEAQPRLDAFLQPIGISEDEFWQRVKTNLQTGNIRLVFAAYSLPRELKLVIEYLNGQMRQTEVLGIELRQFKTADEQHRAIAPIVIGKTTQADAAKGLGERKYPELDDAVSEFVRLTGGDIRVYGGNGHYRQIRLGPGVDSNIHYEFLSGSTHQVTCEFHVEGGPQPALTEAMRHLDHDGLRVAGVGLRFDPQRSRGNGGLVVVPRDQAGQVVAETMQQFMQVTRSRLLDAVAGPVR